VSTPLRSRGIELAPGDEVTVDDERLAQMKKAPELWKTALQAGADYWHTGILPKHFQTSAHGRYDYALRSKKYRQFKHGKPDLVNKGSLRRDLAARADFTQGASVVALKMHARVLNLVPRDGRKQRRQVCPAPRQPGKLQGVEQTAERDQCHLTQLKAGNQSHHR